MKKLLLLTSLTGLVLSSCSKKSSDISQQLQTPISKAIDAQYIHNGADANNLMVEYSTYKANADCDKAVYNAAVETVQGSSGISTVTVVGANLTMVFSRTALAQPATTSLTYGTSLYKAVNQSWPWTGQLLLTKQNTSLTADQFDKAINVKVSAINTGDAAKINSKNVAGDGMLIQYNLTVNVPSGSKSISYEVQTSTPITLKSQFTVSCIIPGFLDTTTTVSLDFSKTVAAAPVQKDLGSGVISYTQQIYPEYVTKTLSEYIAGRYFTEKVYPLVK
ncbi:hypothetical protein [Mucilaginibacter sp. SG564]|uniref:hypothetical protein n=1 Tax=Mucilaginibacter sp. SG564 TaxID=2587022 RepID=UPI00155219D1|nr:hypothetical protein [Mucilaginibacter sp. SG564]NOW99174.1 hypothetical protein [Mucilaginibacter sp. SG564]